MGLTAQGYEKRQPSDVKDVIIKELQNAGSPFLSLIHISEPTRLEC